MKIEVNTFADCVRASERIQALFETTGPLVVEIGKPKRNRSAEQNSLYWKWLTEIGTETGATKEALHETYKEKFLISIFVRDDAGYAEMAKSIAALKKERGLSGQYQAIRKKVIQMTSTTDCSVKQMTEYLNSIKLHAQGDLGIRLTIPDDGLI